MRIAFAIALIVAGVGTLRADDIVGWRFDGTGQYPAARPPTQWSPEKNVLWATSMPDWSNASPVVAGNKLFVQGEPFNLHCVDANTGRILWIRSHGYDEVMTEADRKQAAEDAKRASAVRAEIAEWQGKLKQIGDELRTSQAQATPPVEPELVERRAAEIAERQARLKGLAGEVNAKIQALRADLARHTRWVLPPTNEVNGYSSPTPVTDGRHVWCLFGNSVVACYDLAGERKWIRTINKTTIEDGLSSSPVLVADRGDGRAVLLVHPDALTALDAETGQTLWQAKDTQAGYGTPIVATLGGQQVAITPRGDIVRIIDGTVLARKTGSVFYCSPVVVNSVVYFVQNISKGHGGGEVVRLTHVDGKVAAETLWQTTAARDRYYASPVVHDGLAYVVTQAGIFSVLDAADGKVRKEIRLELGRGTTYPSICLVNELLFVSSDTGRTAVIRPGPDAEVLGVNSLAPFRSTPLFVGGRIYIRGRDTFYCIAPRTP